MRQICCSLSQATWSPLLARVYDWLSPADSVCAADLIFVLAGRQSRKLFALQLFHEGPAATLLLSVGRFEVRKFAQLPWPEKIDLLQLAKATPPSRRHYFVSLEAGTTHVKLIPRRHFGTLSEIRALAGWLEERPGIGSLLVISSAPHLRRVRACCRALLPPRLQVRFIATPNDTGLARDSWWRDRRSRAMVTKEIPKCFVYALILRVVGRRP